MRVRERKQKVVSSSSTSGRDEFAEKGSRGRGKKKAAEIK